MKVWPVALAMLLVVAALPADVTRAIAQGRRPAAARSEIDAVAGEPAALLLAQQTTRQRLDADLRSLGRYRPSYGFWQHIFLVPDGSIAYGSALDGRLLVTFPARGNWSRDATWTDANLAGVLRGESLPSNLSRRREEVARLLEASAGPVLHNATRGLFLLPNAQRYGSFLSEWGAIYERFAVPGEIGLAQAIVESGLNPTVRSNARAIGFCQWLRTNWQRLDRLSPNVIEASNQTTQAPYCAAYLTILATKYGSFVPALSEHHAGGTNVGRTLINGGWLGASSVRDAYFLGSDFATDLRELAPRQFRPLYGTYGPRSALYAEMVFGNTVTVRRLTAENAQTRIYAMRAGRNLPIAEVARQSGLSLDEVKRFNPALIRQVPRGAAVYLPAYIPAFGADVSFWRHPADPAFTEVLNDFVSIDVPLDVWEGPSFDATLGTFQTRFEATGTEEGMVMATTLAYVLQDRRTSREAAILDDYRTSERVMTLFERARALRAERQPEATYGVPDELLFAEPESE